MSSQFTARQVPTCMKSNVCEEDTPACSLFGDSLDFVVSQYDNKLKIPCYVSFRLHGR